LTFSGKKVSWNIPNNGGTPLDIGGIDLMWPQANGKEMKVTLGGVEIYSPETWLLLRQASVPAGKEPWLTAPFSRDRPAY
jgi:hypothetical protein